MLSAEGGGGYHTHLHILTPHLLTQPNRIDVFSDICHETYRFGPYTLRFNKVGEVDRELAYYGGPARAFVNLP